MKKLLIAALIIGLILSVTPANAGLFGQSSCEKAAARINQQDAIGHSLWKILDEAWKRRKASGSTSDNISIVLATEDLWNQYVVMGNIVTSNPQCFKAEQISRVISLRTGAKKVVRNSKIWENAQSWRGYPTDNPMKTYLSFKDVLDGEIK